jgi:hypothetical protein
VIVSRREAMDELLVRAEYAAGHAAPPRLDTLRALPDPNRESPTARARQLG